MLHGMCWILLPVTKIIRDFYKPHILLWSGEKVVEIAILSSDENFHEVAPRNAENTLTCLSCSRRMLKSLEQSDPSLHWNPSAIAHHQKQSDTMTTRMALKIQMLFAVGLLVEVSWGLWLHPTGQKSSVLKCRVTFNSDAVLLGLVEI